jgi:hypothetical protein
MAKKRPSACWASFFVPYAKSDGIGINMIKNVSRAKLK